MSADFTCRIEEARAPTEAEKAAREWLERAHHYALGSKIEYVRERCEAVLRLLDQPRMPKPEELSGADLRAMAEVMCRAGHVAASGDSTLVAIYRALYDRLTAPKTKTVQVWRLEFARRHHVTGDWLTWQEVWPNEEHLRSKAKDLAACPDVACIRVTGPHNQEVPA